MISLVIAAFAVARLAGVVEFEVDASWWTFAAIALVIAIDTSRTAVSLSAARRYHSDALLANALHFGSDLVGTLAVLAGLSAAALGFPEGDAIAALFVAALVIAAATRLVRRNVNVLMDRSPSDAESAAREALSELDPPVDLRRLRVRESGGDALRGRRDRDRARRGGRPGPRGGGSRGGSAEDKYPGADVVVHVEPRAGGEIRERALAAALGVPRVREIHNLSVLEVGDGVRSRST